MLPKTFDMQVCPLCKGSQLKLQNVNFKEGEIWSGEILCEKCSLIYPIINGIPCLLRNEQLEAQKNQIMQEWLQKMKEIEDDIIDEDQQTYKEICKTRSKTMGIEENAERLLWEKKLYIDNRILREELGNKLESKWAIAKENINVRNNHVFRVLYESEGHFTGKQILHIGPGIDDDLITRLEMDEVDIINCDIILDTLMQLRAKNKRQCICLDLKSLPIKNETFDAVFCFHVIHHVHPIERAMSEITRVLKPNGKIFIIEMNTNHLLALLGRILPGILKKTVRRFIRKHTGTNVRICKPSPFEQIIPSKMIIDAMCKAGYINVIRKAVVHAPMCFGNTIVNIWNRMGFRFPAIFDPIAIEYLFCGTKSPRDEININR